MKIQTVRRIKSSLFLGFLTAIVLFEASNVISARTMDDYIFNLQKKYPQIILNWKSVIPTKYKNVSWIGNLEGVTGPTFLVSISEQPFFLGSVCKPHNCGGNQVYFLISMDGKAAYGMLASRIFNVGIYFGSPNNDAKRFMQYLADKGEITGDDPYLKPVSEVIAKGVQSLIKAPNQVPPPNKSSQVCGNYPALCIE